jgi:TadE-like protein
MRSAARCRGDGGTSTTSVALVFLLMLFMLSLIVQYGLNYHAHQWAAGAADRAVAVARWNDASEADGEAAGMVFLQAGEMLVEPTIDVDKGPEEVRAFVEVRVDPLVPLAAWTITAEATAPVERFIPEPERDDPSAG